VNLGINSIVKNLLSIKRAFTLDGVNRIMKQVWSKFSPGLQIKTMKSWEKRVELMVQRKGYHIKNDFEILNVI
jgi:hypothetical protein